MIFKRHCLRNSIMISKLRSSFINLILTGLSALGDSNNLQSNLYEVCSLNRRTLFENFNISTDLWSRNENKLNQLFNFIDE